MKCTTLTRAATAAIALLGATHSNAQFWTYTDQTTPHCITHTSGWGFHVTLANNDELTLTECFAAPNQQQTILPLSAPFSSGTYKIVGITYPGELRDGGILGTYRGLALALTLPSSLRNIGDFAFYNCHAFQDSLIIPNAVTNIGTGAFAGCWNFMGSLAIPDSVLTLGPGAFFECEWFDGTLTLSKSLKEIPAFAFYGCKRLQNPASLVIPHGVTNIGFSAFQHCTSLLEAPVIPNTVTSIEDFAFSSCTSLSGHLNLPDSVTYIGDLAFSL